MQAEVIWATRAIRLYYQVHQAARADDPAGLVGPCQCPACYHARTFFELTGQQP